MFSILLDDSFIELPGSKNLGKARTHLTSMSIPK